MIPIIMHESEPLDLQIFDSGHLERGDLAVDVPLEIAVVLVGLARADEFAVEEAKLGRMVAQYRERAPKKSLGSAMVGEIRSYSDELGLSLDGIRGGGLRLSDADRQIPWVLEHDPDGAAATKHNEGLPSSIYVDMNRLIIGGIGTSLVIESGKDLSPKPFKAAVALMEAAGTQAGVSLETMADAVWSGKIKPAESELRRLVPVLNELLAPARMTVARSMADKANTRFAMLDFRDE
jgi:hypothetical protein